MISGGAIIEGSHIRQRIKWKKVKSVNQNITHFIVKYGLSQSVETHNSTDAQNTTAAATDLTTNLSIPIPTKK